MAKIPTRMKKESVAEKNEKFLKSLPPMYCLHIYLRRLYSEVVTFWLLNTMIEVVNVFKELQTIMCLVEEITFYLIFLVSQYPLIASLVVAGSGT